ncbi:putative cross-wall-targeting lipoprotein signal domain-containing proteiin [Herbiconiux liangxiaofengii]|uniref:putative cross-wall-targeting lipoprotein signal domain-containing proteiin n=1 Tax=Herbiconiux liangxiaofengii TaxID=3342795 RepID=UPI0035B742B8
MARMRPAKFALLCGAALATAAVLAGCSDPAATPEPTASEPASLSTTPTPPPESSANVDYSALCAANDAAAAAKAGTVGEDLNAVSAQASTIRGLLPLQGVSAEVAAGAELFATAAEEDAAILARFPADSLVSDVGLDPAFTQSEATRNAVSDPDYQAFILWTMQTCGSASDEG